MPVHGDTVEAILRLGPDGELTALQLQRWSNFTDDGHFGWVPFSATATAPRIFGGYTIPSEITATWAPGTGRELDRVRPAADPAWTGVVGVAAAPGHAAAAHAPLLADVVGAVQGELAQRGELRLDPVQPGLKWRASRQSRPCWPPPTARPACPSWSSGAGLKSSQMIEMRTSGVCRAAR